MAKAVRKSKTRAQWAAEIRAAHTKSVGAILKLDAVWAAEPPRSGAFSPPHPAHTGANVHAHALACRSRWSADRNRLPTCPIEQAV